MAIIHTHHVSDEADDRFYYTSQPIYKKYNPGDTYDDNEVLHRLVDIEPNSVDESLFEPVFFRAYSLFVQYSAEEYVQLISTFSPTISMQPASRIEFLSEIKDLIADTFDDRIQKHYAMSLTIAKKK
ncbi:MAG: hypothetical protein H6670_13315 [Anaerolineaceae bacterium]|nr:hypothetical protein [Anaerolineaceae bacterium]